MPPSRLARIEKEYFGQTQPELPQPYVPRPIIEWPDDKYLARFCYDLSLLDQPPPEYQPVYKTVAEQVFGPHQREKKVSLKHQANLLQERARLHQRHLQDIDHRVRECQEKLAIARLLSPTMATAHQINLEKLLVQLERERRKEELTFWKDSKDVRDGIFDAGSEYTAMARRSEMLTGMEDEDA
jgi:hypothetical protein